MDTIGVNEIIRTASKAYDDDLILEYWDEDAMTHANTDEPGDTLAKFIAIELGEVCEKKGDRGESVQAAVAAIDRAIEQLQAVRDAISRLD